MFGIDVPRLATVLERFGSKEKARPCMVDREKQQQKLENHVYRKVIETFREKAKESGTLDALNKSLKQLEHHAREFTAGHDQTNDALIYNGCLCVLLVFRHNDESVTPQVSREILQAFGPTSDGPVKRACKTVANIRLLVGANFLRQRLRQPDIPDLINRKDSHSDRKKKLRLAEKEHKMMLDQELKHEFGAKITVNMPKKEKMFDYLALSPHIDIDFHQLNKELGPNAKPNYRMMAHHDVRYNAKNDPTRETGRRWRLTFVGLIEELSRHFDDVDSICQGVFVMLSSESATDNIETVLIDLLGFDKFELVGQILQNRRQLVAEWRSAVSSVHGPNYDPTLIPAEPVKKKKGIKYGQQIVVQSEHELNLQRQLRKGEKKINKRLMQPGFGTTDDYANIELVRQRQLELEAAQTVPTIRQEAAAQWQQYSRTAKKFKYVFDQFSPYLPLASSIKVSVGGASFTLPENTKKRDTRMYEEITVPAISASAMPNVGSLKKIADLDDLCKIGFRGTKQLNTIQSCVFDKAYYTTENLLICAPTGAGKTNIAMLCVLRVLKDFSHIDPTEHRVFRKADFKIVYVAPMKALAAEMARNFSRKLEPLGIAVRELTGDMQLSKREIQETQMLIVTPEKWDVVTRKSTGDTGLSHLVKLLIIDEVHLLHDDRGPVIETLVARTLRQVEMRQNPIRLVGLSATLPNYCDVASFLSVNHEECMFVFDGRFRPVPLTQSFVGVKSHGGQFEQQKRMDDVCYDKVADFAKDGHQVLVFVHARNATGRLAANFVEMAKQHGQEKLFFPESSASYGLAQKAISRSRNRQLQELFPAGFGIHHAGMLRCDRMLVERLFGEGHIRVLCCTSTLAWGVNLPAHAVIIRGTDIYDSKHGAFVDLGILDVQQIFGRAGRPQFDSTGFGIIITQHEKLYRYLSLLTRQTPIESQFLKNLLNNLNAEIVLGTVTNIEEGVEWLKYTYLFVRAQLNPLCYAVSYKTRQADPELYMYRRQVIETAAKKLDQYEMIRFEERTEQFESIDLGRIASHYYINSETVELIVHGDGMTRFTELMTDDRILDFLSHSSEFAQLKIREDEMGEMDSLVADVCHLPVPGGTENVSGKVNILIQSYINQQFIQTFSLVSDTAYVVQNCGRIMRCLFEIAIKRNWAQASGALLKMCKAIERQIWPDQQHPLRQMLSTMLRFETIEKLEKKRTWTVDVLRETDAREIGSALRCDGRRIKEAAMKIPRLKIETSIRPITRTILQINLFITSDFLWDKKLHGSTHSFWIWIENPQDNQIHYSEYFILFKKQADSGEPQKLSFTIPVRELEIPSQYLVKCASDYWLGSETTTPVSFQHLILPDHHSEHTELLDLDPLSVTALGNEKYQSAYNFDYFNAVQTQIFHCLYHTDKNVLVGAPTGSGKTVAAELAMFRVFNQSPNAKCVYIAPMKALVRERIKDWRVRIENAMGKRVVELTGDFTPDIKAIRECSVIVTTPEKWDGISRSWQTRNYVRDVQLVIIDEIHLLGEDRGPVLEVIVARMNFMAGNTNNKVRLVGLSTALANASDLADWLNITEMGLYNFRPSVRPVPTEVHIRGFPGKHYCPRMATMNKPAFMDIKTHSPEKPTLIFVSSRRQTRLTALDLVALLANENNSAIWIHNDRSEMDEIIGTVKDQNLKLFLAFGIGIHHAGLTETDRSTVEELFVNQKIQVLVATATLAWGVNFPAHLVIIKGTEYYDGKINRYVDFPVTDVLQMMGRAGRPQYDDHGVACVYVQDTKKQFYKKFLYEPFPVESSLSSVFPEHLNAEIVSGTVGTKQDAIDYLTWTYFFRRLIKNPSFYGLPSLDESQLSAFLTKIVDEALMELTESSCAQVIEDNRTIQSLTLGKIASFYYLQHKTVRMMKQTLDANTKLPEILKLLTDLPEYDEIPVRHNEDIINGNLAKNCPLKLDANTMDDSHTKAHLLYQVHFGRMTLPSTDYGTDLKSVLDQAIRIIQALLDVSADQGWLSTCLSVVSLLQMIVSARWINDSPLTVLPHIVPTNSRMFKPIETIPELQSRCNIEKDFILKRAQGVLEPRQVSDIERILSDLPKIQVKQMAIRGWWKNDKKENSKNVSLFENVGNSPQGWIPVHADQEYILKIDLERLNKKRDSRAFAPKFPKVKDEGWLVVLGVPDAGELVALKRIGFIRRNSHVSLTLRTPNEPGGVIMNLYLLSDCYIGLDQQYELRLNVIEADIECQINSEVEIAA